MKNKNVYFAVGSTAFWTVAAILLFYDTLFGSRAIVTFGRKLLEALKPILYGAMIAYLLAPAVDFFERHLLPGAVRRARERGQFRSAGARLCSLLLTWSLLFGLVYLLLSVLLPELVRSVQQLLANLETYYNTIDRWLNSLFVKNPDVETWASNQIDVFYRDLLGWLSDRVLPQTQQVMTAVSGGIVSALIFAKNLAVGLIAATYLLATKELSAARCRRLACAVFPESAARWIFRGLNRADGIFSGFVRGKLLDALIIGVLCFFFSTLFHFPYAPLISVMVGVSNVIPFFGPFLGAIPSLLLILLVSPIQALYFLIFIIALQQVDGNLIDPKILGDRTGLSSLWVIVAILVGGSFFGIPGMFFGVPVFACAHTLVRFLTDACLRRRRLPVEDGAYARPEVPKRSAPPNRS